MIEITIVGQPLSASQGPPIHLAGTALSIDTSLSEIRPFRIHPITARIRSTAPVHPPPASPWLSRGFGNLGSWDIAFSAEYDPRSGYLVDLGYGLRLRVAVDGSELVVERPGDLPEDDPVVVRSVLGPGLLLALALRGSFALHAGAVARGGRAAVFLGDSGAGKSTLAAALDRRRAGGWRRLADDVLPVTRAADGGIDALPEFPQLKLGPEEQYVADPSSPERLPVAAFYLLETPAADEDAVTITTVSPRDAAVALLAHTVASRLFAPDLAARHFAFCAAAAAAVPLKRLRYPRRLQALDAVAEALAADLGI